MTFRTTDFGYILTLEPGDELVRSLIQFARDHEVDAALVTAIGSVTELELGTGGGRDRDHRRRTFDEALEACTVSGVVTLVDGEPFPHLHGTFSRDDHSVIGGHVYEAVAGAGMDVVLQDGAGALDGFATSGTATNRKTL